MEKYSLVDTDSFLTNSTTSVDSKKNVQVPIVSKQISKKKANKINTKKLDYSQVKIIGCDPPSYVLPTHKYSKAKMSVTFYYTLKDDKEKKVHEKTVFFGKSDKDYFVDHGNEACRLKAVDGKNKPTNEFEPLFWEYYLLNGKEDLVTNFRKLRDIMLS